ncbi:delphilin-like isoform X3 [Dysidea avara]|uniref:delphilin-like isoform X3 n=1 Tax=Dysidea avara TaxID=196820 RepID=UPI003317F636
MPTNLGWPDAFGFRISGRGPVVITDVDDTGSAHTAGLQPGDIIVELNGECVRGLSKQELIQRARVSTKCPPSMVVVSKVKVVTVPRSREGGFGITLRGDSPVYIRSVEFSSTARTAGIRSGDLILEINEENVRYSSKSEVLELMKHTGRKLHLVLISGSINSTVTTRVPRQETAGHRYDKAKSFHQQMEYYLAHNRQKKTRLLALLKAYSKDKNVENLAHSLELVLINPMEKKLLKQIRLFLPPEHQRQFDVAVSVDSPDGGYDLAQRRNSQPNVGRPLGMRSSRLGSVPNLSIATRLIQIDRSRRGFGFTLSGSSPVFVQAIDHHGAATRAGLRAGDHILEINGINVRNATHSHVIKLLKGSGMNPTLLVSSDDHYDRRRWSRVSSSSTISTTDHRRRSAQFTKHMEQVLSQEDRRSVVEHLGEYSKNKDIQQLASSLALVLSDPSKTSLLHEVCQLLPASDQAAFDRIAASVVTEGVPPNTDNVEMLYRVQGGLLPQEMLYTSHQVPSHHFKYGPSPLLRGQRFSSDLDVFPTRDSSNVSDTTLQSPHPSSSHDEVTTSTPQSNMEPQNNTEPQSLESMLQKANLKTLNSPDSSVNTTTVSTPGGIPPPPPAPPTTPQGGITIGSDGVPIPPPPPPPAPPVPGQLTAPQIQLRRVNWEKLQSDGLDGTIWRQLSGSMLEDALDFADLAEQFSKQDSAKQAAAVKKDKKNNVLDSRKTYNISILLAHLKLPPNKIKQALLAMDTTILSEQHLKQMEAFAPDKKEALAYAKYIDDPSVLSLPDQFSCEMSTIPGYRERLRAMIFQMHFHEKILEVTPDFEAIKEAAIQLEQSKSLKKLLELILAFGNYLNAGNHRIAGAVGFKIKFLTQLKSTRTVDKKSSLIHVLVKTVENKFPWLLNVGDELNAVSKAARISGETLDEELQELKTGLQEIKTELEEFSTAEKLPGDKFEEIMGSFVTEADAQLSTVLALQKEMMVEYQKAVKLFGENVATTRVDDFFAMFAGFIKDFEDANRELAVLREQENFKERRLKEKEEMARKSSLKKLRSSTSTQEVSSSDEELHQALSRWSSRLASTEQNIGYTKF